MMGTPAQNARAAAQAVRDLDNWYQGQYESIMASETLTPTAKKKHLGELRREYQKRWLSASDNASRSLQEWRGIYESRAEDAWSAKMPDDKDARILKSLELQRLNNRITQLKDNPGRLLAEYRRLARSDDVLASELEEVLPELLPPDERPNFAAQARENKLYRMSEEDKRKVDEAEEFKREADSIGLGLALMQSHRNAGFVPGKPGKSALVTSYPPGRPPQTDEIPNPMHRHHRRYETETPVSQPRGGVIGPDPGDRTPRKSSPEDAA